MTRAVLAIAAASVPPSSPLRRRGDRESGRPGPAGGAVMSPDDPIAAAASGTLAVLVVAPGGRS